MKSLFLASVSASIIAAAGMSNAATVSFDQFNEGDILGLGTDLGGGVIADISAAGGIGQAVVFDTTPGTTSTANDPDLQSDFADAEGVLDSRGFGNALIVQESASGGPDDNASGGSLTFSFLDEIRVGSVYLLDTAEETTATLFRNDIEVLRFILDESNESDTGNNPNNNEFTFLNFGGARGDSLVISFSESGAVGELDLTVVPVPAGLPLLLGGLGVFAWARKRKNAA